MNDSFNKEIVNYILNSSSNITSEFKTNQILLDGVVFDINSAFIAPFKDSSLKLNILHIRIDDFNIFVCNMDENSPVWIISNLDYQNEILHLSKDKIEKTPPSRIISLLQSWEDFISMGWAWYPSEELPILRKTLEKFLTNG